MANDPPESAARPITHVTQVSSTTVFSGPLPPPQWLAEYERIQPGLSIRLIEQAEAEAGHRRAQAESSLAAESRHASRGQWMAFVLSLSSLAVAGWLAATAGPWAATPFALTALSPIVAAFLKQRSRPVRP
ncbi:MAG TPA: DUF2335 domain-containing protein [Planctomycetota bacterium]|nr:DUF2335 domain-containing protein [Planctomycetota bacterium]